MSPFKFLIFEKQKSPVDEFDRAIIGLISVIESVDFDYGGSKNLALGLLE